MNVFNIDLNRVILLGEVEFNKRVVLRTCGVSSPRQKRDSNLQPIDQWARTHATDCAADAHVKNGSDFWGGYQTATRFNIPHLDNPFSCYNKPNS